MVIKDKTMERCVLHMKVWRIRSHEKGPDTYIGHLCSSKEAGCVLLIHSIDALFRENKWPYKDKYTYIDKVTVRETGHWIHKDLGLDWEVVEEDFETDDEKERRKIEKTMYTENDDWFSIDDEENRLEDGVSYDIELDTGEFVYDQVFQEDIGAFGEEGIEIINVKGFRRV